MIIFIENTLCLIKSSLIEFNRIIQSFFVLVIPFVIMFSALFYFVRSWQKYHKMNERALDKKNKVLIQGVHGSGKTYKLLFDNKFVKDNEIFKEKDSISIRSRIYNEEFLEHEFRIKNNDEDKNVKKDIIYISCTGLTIEEIYTQMIQSCFDKGIFGVLSKLLTNIKSLNILQTTIEFSFSSRWFMYNTNIKYIIVDDIDRMATNNFELDINRLLGLLKNLELFYHFILLYANSWENEITYAQKGGLLNLPSKNGNVTIGSFAKRNNYDRLFNELVIKSNFTKNIFVKISKPAVKKVVSENICDEFKFYSDSLSDIILSIDRVDIDVRVVKRVIDEFNAEFRELKKQNIIYSKLICYDLAGVMRIYYSKKLKLYINREAVGIKGVSLMVKIDNVVIFNFKNKGMKEILNSENFGDKYNKNHSHNARGEIRDFRVEDLLDEVEESCPIYNRVIEELSSIIAKDEELNFENVTKLWNDFKKKYGIDG